MKISSLTRQFIYMIAIGGAGIPGAQAWDMYNYETDSYIDVESYDQQDQGGGEVEYYDYASENYKTGHLDMNPGGEGELTDYESGNTYQVEME